MFKIFERLVKKMLTSYLAHRGKKMFILDHSKENFCADGLFSIHNCSFKNEKKFIEAYAKGINSGHLIGGRGARYSMAGACYLLGGAKCTAPEG